MKIMTFNLRYALADDGPNSWRFRNEFATRYMLDSGADVLCMQEVVPAVKEELTRSLGKAYALVGEGRLAEPRADDEINLVAYRKDSVELMAHEHFWLSETPDVPGSRYPTQIHWPRTCTHVRLKMKSGVYELYATHLDNADPVARERGLCEILGRAGTTGKTLVCGDMNDVPKNVHAWVNGRLTDLTDAIPYTYNGFGEETSKIDYILASKDIRVLSPCVCEHKMLGAMYVSDHFPMWIELE